MAFIFTPFLHTSIARARNIVKYSDFRFQWFLIWKIILKFLKFVFKINNLTAFLMRGIESLKMISAIVKNGNKHFVFIAVFALNDQKTVEKVVRLFYNLTDK